jgi:hypothetical protein
MPTRIPEPWGAFLSSLDDKLSEPVELVCIGGFVVSLQYGLPRPTADVDVLEVRPSSLVADLDTLAGLGSPLYKKHRVYLQKVTVNTCPEAYEDRLTEMYRGAFSRLRLLALDPYDLALSKLERNIDRDREDVYYLAKTIPLDLELLQSRYREEMRPYLGDQIQERSDRTIRMWVEAIREQQGA